jgi:type VI secretion system protein ImpB
MSGSFQNEIPPARINLKLDVGKGNAKKKIELPLKKLVVGEFSFKKHNDRVVDREKISINKENFTQVMESMNLNLKFNVENKLTGSGDLAVDLNIKNLDSFKPENVAKSIPALSKLLAARNLLKDLKSNLLDNRDFRKRLEQILKDPNATKTLQDELKKLIAEEKTEEKK